MGWCALVNWEYAAVMMRPFPAKLSNHEPFSKGFLACDLHACTRREPCIHPQCRPTPGPKTLSSKQATRVWGMCKWGLGGARNRRWAASYALFSGATGGGGGRVMLYPGRHVSTCIAAGVTAHCNCTSACTAPQPRCATPPGLPLSRLLLPVTVTVTCQLSRVLTGERHHKMRRARGKQ